MAKVSFAERSERIVRAVLCIQKTIQVTSATAMMEVVPAKSSSAVSESVSEVEVSRPAKARLASIARPAPRKILEKSTLRPDLLSALSRIPIIKEASRPSRKAIIKVESMVALSSLGYLGLPNLPNALNYRNLSVA